MKLLDAILVPEMERPRAPILARLGLTDKAVDSRDAVYEGRRWGKDPVPDSEDLQRIVALPRRPRPSLAEQARMAEEMTARLTLGPVTSCRCAELRPGIKDPCITALLPIQGWYLYEAAQVGGAVGHIIVGGGKTGIDILLPMVLPSCQRAVLLIMPALREQFAIDFQCWSQHFQVPNLAGGRGHFDACKPTLDVLAYSALSHESCATWLISHRPDAIIADEGQNLKDKESVRGSRFLRYFIEAQSDTHLFVHSGSLTTRSLDDYGHLAALALREGSPLPLETSALTEWCGAIDAQPPGVAPCPMGALKQLGVVGEDVRAAFRRRLVETVGVITTEDAELKTGLRLLKRDPGEIPAVLKGLLKYTRERETRPDGEVLKELSEIALVCRQLASGFFYRWKYPRGEPQELILEWFAKRQAWFRELRERLQHRSDLLDSPKLCEDAARRFHEGYEGELPVWDAQCWPEWNEIEERVQPARDTVWVDDFLARDAVRWAAEAPGIVWYGHTAFGQKVAELGGLTFFGGGEQASREILKEDGSRSIVASIKAHGVGKNLQAFSRNLVANPPTEGWEQLLGRTHRTGQAAERVDAWVYRHTEEVSSALDKATELSKYVFQTVGKAEKLIYAERYDL